MESLEPKMSGGSFRENDTLDITPKKEIARDKHADLIDEVFKGLYKSGMPSKRVWEFSTYLRELQEAKDDLLLLENKEAFDRASGMMIQFMSVNEPVVSQ